MKNSIETTFAGLTLRNPIIVASCSLTGSVSSVAAFAKAGAGAIVLKSLFEEDIARESEALMAGVEYGEGADYMQSYVASNALGEYVKLIKDSKSNCGEIPIIASINCHTAGEWAEYARSVERAGADALELNVMTVESDPMGEDGDLERRHISIAQLVCGAVKIPVIMKLGAMVSNHASLVSRLVACGVKGFVLFNRAYQSDIDIESMSYVKGSILSSADSLQSSLRHIALLSSAVPNGSFALSGGVTKGDCVIKSILAGASAVEVCSTLYREADVEGWMRGALHRVEQWQESKGYESIEQWQGAMSGDVDEHREEIVRAHFLKYFGSYTK